MTAMNVSLTPALAKMVREKVASGLYNNASEVVREALRQFDTNAELLYELKLAHLKGALAPGIAEAKAGEFVEFSPDSIIKELNGESR